MLQLVVGGAGNHAFDFADGAIDARAAGILGNAEPYSPAGLLDGPGQGAVIDDLVANCDYAARLLQRLRTNQHATSGRSSHPAARIANPCGWVQQEEKEHEGWNQEPLCKCLAMQLDHERGEV